MVNGIRKAAFACEKYVSGKSMDDVMRDYGLSSVVKLGSNENMYGPYPHALEAMRDEVSLINIYPERNYIKLKELLADKFGVADSTWVSLGHGAGNVLDSIAKTLLEEGDEVLVPEQSYRLYPEISKIMGAKVIEVPLTDRYSIDLHDYAKLLTDRTKIVWLCNPNNPTGTVVPIDDFTWFVDQMPADCWLVVDEAYAEFADADVLPDVIAAIKSGKQVIDVRTFSKYYGLAGGRIGYLIADPEFVNWYDTVSEPFNSNRTGLAGAVALLEQDTDECRRCRDLMVVDRERMNAELAAMGCTPVKSHANFVFFEMPYDASQVAELLLRRGVIVRPCGGWGYPNHMRVSIGTTEQNDAFLSAIRDVFAEMAKR
ncbi:histidinol-phosphate transaminase [Bifidobacterium breve]|jgi:histidinol-phosphate aminotransferase|uniref:histidinol-phosphate transaminase n=1 Tax=Bifidobacterium breve TaxID=1685 RepID=UPI0006C7CC45|nr:histidinol-phosphate transaminase [Bifidobacterium breve]AZI16303.1 histidinol-phosphate transaminase [Bifidobacterium breve]MCI2118050.1 histidinol-phosphate transaminase [Bifidobacterium breve]MCI2129930.1 histidinol-phosphate transaminase [Bifidobacterium breve]MDX5147332.1 histidinol-phosphate transaminase [Bifidobacterium breve]